MKKLTLKQEAFKDAYLGEARGNATEAYRLAGYAGTGDTARINACKLLTNPNISAAIAKAREGIAKRAGDTHDSILAEMNEAIRLGFEYKQISAAIRGIELKGKQQGMFPNNFIGNVTQTITHEHRDVSETLGWLEEFSGSDTQETTEDISSDRPLLPN